MADFDVIAARQAGYKDPEIEQYLAGQGWAPRDVAALLRAPQGPPQGMPSLTGALDMRPTPARPIVGGPGLDTSPEAGEQLLRNVIMPAFALGSGGMGGPAAIGARTMALPIAQALIGPFDNPDPDVMSGAASPRAGRVLNALGQTVRGMIEKSGSKKIYVPLEADVQALAATLNPENPLGAMREATARLKWANWDRPAAVKNYGAVRPANGTEPRLRRYQNTQDAVQSRVEGADVFLREPTEPWTPTDYGIFDRGLIKDAMEGFPGVEQTAFPRRQPTRANTSHVDEVYTDPGNRDLIKRQIARGLPLGGKTFYPSQYPVKVAAQEAGIPAEVFDDWINSVAPGSARNSIYNERAVGNFLRGMHARGIPLTAENVKAEMELFKAQKGMGLPLMDVHRSGTAAVLEGGQDPVQVLRNDATDAYKIPTYSANQRGNFAKSWTGDVHEANGETLGTRYNPYFTEQGGFGVNEYGPAESHMQSIADEMGLPLGTAQAGRWFGGGELTGLKSPRGDSLDLLERQAAYTMHEHGLPTTPQAVRKYILDLMQRGGTMLPWFKGGPMPDYRMRAPASQSRR